MAPPLQQQNVDRVASPYSSRMTNGVTLQHQNVDRVPHGVTLQHQNVDRVPHGAPLQQ